MPVLMSAQVGLELAPGMLIGINALLAIVMVGVALELRLDELRDGLTVPLGPGVGIAAQVLALPATSYLLIRLLDPPAEVALGMLIIACAPGGAVSNAITHLAGANAFLSIALTGLSTALATVTMPANLAFWGTRTPGAAELLRAVALNPWELLGLLALVLALPVSAGLARLPPRDRRALSLEVGMQNSALALTVSLTFFADVPVAALIAATWGA